MDMYAPKSLADIVIGNEVGDFVVRNIANGKIPFPIGGKNGFLFHGPFGTGKTTLAKLLPDEIERFYGNAPPPSFYLPQLQMARLMERL